MSKVIDDGLITGNNLETKVDVVIGVDDIGAALQSFGWADYFVFVVMLSICVVIGVYYGFFKSASSSQDYLVGGRSMKTFPIAMSLIASYISGISLLGIPTEIYVYGVQYIYIIGGLMLMAVVMDRIYLPVFHELKLTSTYEYLERRFDKRVRILASVLFSIGLFVWLPIVIYVPALAFNQVTGVNVHFVTPTVCVICIFYTSMGGIKAVVLTDVIQTIIMVGAILLVIVKGTLDIGGASVVWNRNWKSDRIELPNLDISPLTRHTIWSLTIGGFVYLLQTGAVNQNMIQRYLALPDLKTARRAVWLFASGILILICLCAYSGMLIFATFYKCDPLTTTLAREKDQLLPLLVMQVLGNFPGLPGLFVAGIFSAALSSLSTGLNSMAAVVLEDCYKSFFRKELTNKETSILMQSTVVLMGVICVGLVFVVEKLGTVLQLTMSIGAIANGPSLGLFTMGILLPWVSANGALIGSSSGLVFMSWLTLKAQAAIASGDILFPLKPVTTEGCHYQFTPKASPFLNLPPQSPLDTRNVVHADEVFLLYRLSYLWYNLVGALVSMIVGMVVSFLTKPLDPRDVDPKLLAPFIRKLIPSRDFPNQPNSEGIIYAYELPVTKNGTSQAEMGKTNDSQPL